MSTAWTVVVPVKPPSHGKSRLEMPGVDRAALARAIALDTIAAAAAGPLVGRVVVVTDDGGFVLAAAGIPGLRFVAETPTASEALAEASPDARDLDHLNSAIRRGAITAAGPVAALLGDLPALRPEDLAAVLEQAADHDRAVVADAEGDGSTLVTATAGIPWRSSFGDGSFTRHVALGCTPLDAPESLRRDVDTAEQLREAATLGLGPHTAALLAASP